MACSDYRPVYQSSASLPSSQNPFLSYIYRRYQFSRAAIVGSLFPGDQSRSLCGA